MLGSASYKTILDTIGDGVYVVDRDRTILYWNKGAEAHTGFGAGEVVGKKCLDSILTHIDCHGKNLCRDGCPLALTAQDGQTREADVYFHHKQGHRVPTHVIAAPLRDGSGQIVGVVEVFNNDSAAIKNRQAIATLKKMAFVDAMTGLPNRRYCEACIQSRLDELRRQGWPFAAAFFDIDRLKEFNDAHGQTMGDKAVRMIGSALANGIRSIDMLGRWGEDMFFAILTGASGDDLFSIPERARVLAAESYLCVDGRNERLTVSIGVTPAAAVDSPERLLHRADAALMQAKAAGRNCVKVYRASTEPRPEPTTAAMT